MIRRKSSELGDLQIKVLSGLAEGQGLNEISEQMHLSEITVKLIAKNAAKNLDANTVEAAVAIFAAEME